MLEDSLVVYIDELGTRVRVANMGDDDLQFDVNANRNLRVRLFAQINKVGSGESKIVTFSDNFVIMTPTDLVNEMPYITLFAHIEEVASYQLLMALNGRFLRGGFTIGKAFADEHLATGPALIDAVVMEEKLQYTHGSSSRKNVLSTQKKIALKLA